MRQTLSLVIALVFVNSSLLADDFSANWHQWRGPNADGSSATADPPIEWSPTNNVKWMVEVPGKGSATPIVWGDRIFIVTAIKTDRKKEGADADTAEPPRQRNQQQQGRRRRGFGGSPPANYYQFALVCYDRKTGQEMWRRIATEQVPHESGHQTNTFASSSPVTNGERIYLSLSFRGVYCFDMDGNEKWTRDFGQMQTRNRFGEGSSLSLHDNTLVVPWDHEGQSAMIALDAATGETKWRTERDERTTWATPFIVEHDGSTQVLANGHTVRSYDLATGKLIWECGGQVDNPIPSPVAQDDTVLCMTGYRGNAIYAIPLDAGGDITDSDKVAWQRNDAAPYVASPTLYKGQLYFTKS
jgi:outer membrane protein assembly factor BamB